MQTLLVLIVPRVEVNCTPEVGLRNPSTTNVGRCLLRMWFMFVAFLFNWELSVAAAIADDIGWIKVLEFQSICMRFILVQEGEEGV